MNSTKILVIPKGIVIGAAIAVAVLIGMLAVMAFSDKSDVKSSLPSSGKVAESAGSVTYESNAAIQEESDVSEYTSEDLYVPGVYTSSIWLDNSAVSVKVTVDSNNINGIDISYTDEAITTMYPMLGTCFNELAAEVCSKNSTKNVTYSTENRYTASVILKGIEASLDKALR